MNSFHSHEDWYTKFPPAQAQQVSIHVIGGLRFPLAIKELLRQNPLVV